MKSMIAEAVATAIKTTSDKATVDASVDQQFQEYVISPVNSASKKKKVTITNPPSAEASSTTAQAPPAVTLNSILGRIHK